MIALLGSLIGFISSLAPDLFKLLADRRDKAHELDVLEAQIEMQKLGVSQHLEEIRLQTDAAMYQAAHAPQQITGIHWVDALNASVRPVIAYAFFALYAAIKVMKFATLSGNNLPWQIDMLWTDEDLAIFSGIISFYFGSRALKARQQKG